MSIKQIILTEDGWWVWRVTSDGTRKDGPYRWRWLAVIRSWRD